MVSYYKLRILLTVVVASAVATTYATSEGEIPLPPAVERTKVHITNHVEGGGNLLVRCKDPTGDSGIREVPHRQTYEFEFFGSSHPTINCEFVFGDVTHLFDIYLRDRDYGKCGALSDGCNWLIFDAGPCLHDPTGIYVPVDECYPWGYNN